MASLAAIPPVVALVALIFVIISALLIFYALRIKGDVFAELSHGKTTFRIHARDRKYSRKSDYRQGKAFNLPILREPNKSERVRRVDSNPKDTRTFSIRSRAGAQPTKL